MDHISSFIENGIIEFGPIIDKKKCAELYEDVLKTRDWSENLFRSQEEVEKDPKFDKANPGLGVFNLAEKYDLSFIEDNEIVKDHLERILGLDYEILLKKFICGVPPNWVPKWLMPEATKKVGANMGRWIKPEYRDITYFRGLEYHQDLIDHPGQTGEYVTFYVYLDDVDIGMSALNVVAKSHMYGATMFPHCLENEDKEACTIDYGPDENHMTTLNTKVLPAERGYAFLWSSITLHGTRPQTSDKARISLRYTFKKNDNNKKNELINDLLNSSEGPLTTEKGRDDINLETFEQVKFDKVLR